MKKLIGTALAVALCSVVAVPSFGAAPYKIPPGQYCKGMSKKKVSGQKKSPFAQCVTAMAKVDKGTSPSKACASLGKGAKGKKGKSSAKKALKQCLAAGKKLNSDKAAG